MFGLFRFILAVNVVIFHILAVPAVGPLAVYSFFVLSGFLMTTIMHKTYGYSLSGLKSYAINRFLRLFPVYWGLLLVTIAILLLTGNDFAGSFHSKMTLPDTTGEWLANISMLYPAYFPADYGPRLAPATWALTIELFYYLLIGLGLSRNRMISVIWLLASILFIVGRALLSGKFELGYGDFATASLPFAIGACLYHFKHPVIGLLSVLKISKVLPITVLFTLNIALCVCAYLIKYDWSWKLGLLTTLANLPLTAAMVLVLLQTKAKTSSQRFWDKLTGDWSYPVYVFHWAAACLVAWISGWSLNGNGTVPLFILCLLLTLVLSTLVNIGINQPIELLRNRLKTQIATNKTNSREN